MVITQHPTDTFLCTLHNLSSPNVSLPLTRDLWFDSFSVTQKHSPWISYGTNLHVKVNTFPSAMLHVLLSSWCFYFM